MLPVVGWNETAHRRQFCFISVLFHYVRRALYTTTVWTTQRIRGRLCYSHFLVHDVDDLLLRGLPEVTSSSCMTSRLASDGYTAYSNSNNNNVKKKKKEQIQ